jgi:hypothetical protein
MSKYLTIDELNIDNQEMLVATLQNDLKFFGEKGLVVESHAVPMTLFDWHGKARPEQAEVVIRRQFVGPAANDLGFVRGESGNFRPIISAADNFNYGPTWRDELSQKYGERKYEQDMYQSGFQLDSKEIQQDGTTAMTFSRMGGF